MVNQAISIQDQHHRPLRDIRISVTDRCNFRCSYCMPADIFGPDFPFLQRKELLTFEEISRLVKCFAEVGVKKVRLTGGEPLLRKDLHILIKQLSLIDGIEDIALTTNGIYLPKYAKELKQAGLQRVNISLDAIEDEIFKKMNGRSVGVSPVLKGIAAAKKEGLIVKVNMVVKKGLNDSQIIPMAKYFKKEEIPIRYIEFMDVGSTNGWNYDQVVTKKQIFHQLEEHFELEPVEQRYFGEVATCYRHKGTDTEVGFITSVSESFCSSCTRARISADGKMYNCLFASKGHDFKKILRANASSETIIEEIKKVWGARHDRYSDERTEHSAKMREKIEMSYIGG
ncbi:GTP 3',8-cyclase MoaA [Cytobacillus sp. Hm23]